MLYFSKKKIDPDSIDPEQYEAVKNLKKEYQKKGLTTDFDSSEDFRSKFQRHLSMKLNEPEYLTATAEISLTNNEFNTIEVKYNLSNEAKLLLKEASKDPSGEIMKLSYIGGGLEIHTNGKEINEDISPRTKAKWDAVINQLLSLDLISDVGYKGEIFHLTNKGYKIADELN